MSQTQTPQELADKIAYLAKSCGASVSAPSIVHERIGLSTVQFGAKGWQNFVVEILKLIQEGNHGHLND